MARALVLEAPRRLSERDLAVPAIGDDDAVLRVEACGLCGTDHEQWSGALPVGFAFVPGHEAVGVIERIGPLAAESWGVQPGDRVAVEVFQSCRACPACRAGASNRCQRHGIGDMYGFIPFDRAPGLWGGYAEMQYLSPDSVVHRVPDVLDPTVATLFNPVGAGLRWAVSLPGTKPGDVVAVLGPGIRGLSATAAAKDAGVSFVMVTGAGERDRDRLAWAARFGADLTVDVTTDDPVAALRSSAGRLADVVVDVTAKAPSALAQAVDLCRPGGTVVLAGTRGRAGVDGFVPDLVVFKELRLLGALGVDAASYEAALAMLARGRWPFADVPRDIVGFDGADGLLRAMAGERAEPPPVHAVVVPR